MLMLMTKPTILIVDDEDHFRESLSEVLGEEFHPLAASNVRDGLALIDEGPVSLILLDLQMPGLTGIDLLESLRSKNNNTPVFILTGNSCQDRAERCADLNVQGYVKKPVDAESLVCRIKKFLGVEDFDVLRELRGDDYEVRMADVSPLVKKAIGYIRQNYRNNLTREEMALHLDVSPEHLSRKFHKECGLSLKEYINMYRISKSKGYLKEVEKKIGDVALSVGIPDLNYFCKLFKRFTGLTPNDFRKSLAF